MKKPINLSKLDASNKELLLAISTELDEVQNRCSVRCLSASDVIEVLKSIESHFCKLGIKKTHLDGVTVLYRSHCENFARKYKHTPFSTALVFENKKGKWFLTDIDRLTCNNEPAYTFNYPESVRNKIISNLHHRLL